VDRKINPLVSEGQIYGGATMGMDYLSNERLITARAIATLIYDVIGVTVKDFSIIPKKKLLAL
jgi:hypothetical protein